MVSFTRADVSHIALQNHVIQQQKQQTSNIFPLQTAPSVLWHQYVTLLCRNFVQELFVSIGVPDTAGFFTRALDSFDTSVNILSEFTQTTTAPSCRTPLKYGHNETARAQYDCGIAVCFVLCKRILQTRETMQLKLIKTATNGGNGGMVIMVDGDGSNSNYVLHCLPSLTLPSCLRLTSILFSNHVQLQ